MQAYTDKNRDVLTRVFMFGLKFLPLMALIYLKTTTV